MSYANGEGVKKDLGEAVAWFKKSADQGHAKAQLNMGYCYAHGIGVDKDPKQAMAWFKKSADQGNADAARFLRGMK